MVILMFRFIDSARSSGYVHDDLSDILHHLGSAANAVSQSEISDRDRIAKEDNTE